MGEAEGSHTEAHDLSSGPQENRGGAESAMGEGQGEESSIARVGSEEGHICDTLVGGLRF